MEGSGAGVPVEVVRPEGSAASVGPVVDGTPEGRAVTGVALPSTWEEGVAGVEDFGAGVSVRGRSGAVVGRACAGASSDGPGIPPVRAMTRAITKAKAMIPKNQDIHEKPTSTPCRSAGTEATAATMLPATAAPVVQV